MAKCSLCNKPTASRDPFCKNCGHSRIAASLESSPEEESPQLENVFLVIALATALALVLTVGVAFLREAKALRWARTAIENDNASKAHRWITPFVKTHPDHLEALYLAGVASLSMENFAEAEKYYEILKSIEEDERAVTTTAELQRFYRRRFITIASNLECGQTPFAEFHQTISNFGNEFHGSMLDGAAALARKCVFVENPSLANEPGAWLIHGLDLEARTVTLKLYVQPAMQALTDGEYRLAQHLVIQGTTLIPEIEGETAPLFQSVREIFPSTVEDARQLCEAIAESYPENAEGKTCFSRHAPLVVTQYRDELGNPLFYEPIAERHDEECITEFELRSWTPARPPAGGAELAGKSWSKPEITVRYDSRWERCVEEIDPFWLPE